MATIPEIGQFFKGMEQWNDAPVGKLQCIKWDKKTIEDDWFGLDPERLLELIQAFVRCEFGAIADAHTSACGSGYMSAICPIGVCPSGSVGTARSLAALGEEQDSRVVRLPAAKLAP